MLLEVRPDPLNCPDNARLLYQATLSLRSIPPTFPPIPSTVVGQIESYRISKSTAALPGNLSSWIDQFLQLDILAWPAGAEDMCILLQSVYDQAGVPLATLDAKMQQDLKDDSLLYLKLVNISDAHQRLGLSKYLFNLYYALLRQLPECKFTFLSFITVQSGSSKFVY